MIHEPGIYFGFQEPQVTSEPITEPSSAQMLQGDIYIFQNYIYIKNNNRWYTVDIKEIKKIKTQVAQKQLIIYFLDYNLVLFSENYTHLLAIRDFLCLSHRYSLSKDFFNTKSGSLGGSE